MVPCKEDPTKTTTIRAPIDLRSMAPDMHERPLKKRKEYVQEAFIKFLNNIMIAMISNVRTYKAFNMTYPGYPRRRALIKVS